MNGELTEQQIDGILNEFAEYLTKRSTYRHHIRQILQTRVDQVEFMARYMTSLAQITGAGADMDQVDVIVRHLFEVSGGRFVQFDEKTGEATVETLFLDELLDLLTRARMQSPEDQDHLDLSVLEGYQWPADIAPPVKEETPVLKLVSSR